MDEIWILPVTKIVNYLGFNPIKYTVWEGYERYDDQFYNMIDTVVKSNKASERYWDYGKENLQNSFKPTSINYHAERVAYFVLNGIDHPICIDLYYYNRLSGCIVTDGFHRLCAAIYKKQVYVPCTYSDSIQLFEELFPNRRFIKG